MTKHKQRKTAPASAGQTNRKKQPNNATKPTSAPSAQYHKQPQQQQRPQQHIKPVIPFEAEDRILLVGEGDFSFTRSIIEDHGCCDITATCFDSKDELFRKYDPQGRANVGFIGTDEGQMVYFSVDATKLDAHKQLRKAGRFDRIIFNFPHVGGKSKDVNRQVRSNQELLVKFFKSAVEFLAGGGMIVVTLFEGEPYTLWNVKDLARHSGLEVVRSFKFLADAYPGYRHARTLGNLEGGGGWRGEDREARSFCFKKREGGVDGSSGACSAQLGKNDVKKRKRQEESSDDDG